MPSGYCIIAVCERCRTLSHCCSSIRYPPWRSSSSDITDAFGGMGLCLYPDTTSKPHL